MISCAVTASNSTGSASQVSNEVGPVEEAGDGPEPFATEDFSGYSIGSSVVGQNIWTGGNGNGATVRLAPDGRPALRFTFSPNLDGDNHYWCEQRYDLGRNLQEFWLELDLYIPDGTEADGSARYEHTSTGANNNRKFLSIFANDYQREPLSIYQLWRRGSTTDSNLNLAYSYGDLDGDSVLLRYYRVGGSVVNVSLIEDSDRGQWVNMRFYHKIADLGVYNGESRVWKNGTLIFSAEGMNNWDEGETENYIRRGYLLGDDNTEGRYQATTHLYITDVKVWDEDPGWDEE